MTSPQPVVYLRGIHSGEMESVLEYLYLGQTQISQQKVDQFFKVATDLKIKDISKSSNKDISKCSEKDTSKSSNKDISKSYDIKEDREIKKTDETNVVEEEEKEVENPAVKTNVTTNLHSEVENQVKFENYEIHACNYCKRKFTLENSLRKHIETIHSKSEHSCSQCETSFRDETSLRHHLQSEHAGAKLTCRQCNEKYSSKAGLKFHMKRVHNNAQWWILLDF